MPVLSGRVRACSGLHIMNLVHAWACIHRVWEFALRRLHNMRRDCTAACIYPSSYICTPRNFVTAKSHTAMRSYCVADKINSAPVFSFNKGTGGILSPSGSKIYVISWYLIKHLQSLYLVLFWFPTICIDDPNRFYCP